MAYRASGGTVRGAGWKPRRGYQQDHKKTPKKIPKKYHAKGQASNIEKDTFIKFGVLECTINTDPCKMDWIVTNRDGSSCGYCNLGRALNACRNQWHSHVFLSENIDATNVNLNDAGFLSKLDKKIKYRNDWKAYIKFGIVSDHGFRMYYPDVKKGSKTYYTVDEVVDACNESWISTDFLRSIIDGYFLSGDRYISVGHKYNKSKRPCDISVDDVLKYINDEKDFRSYGALGVINTATHAVTTPDSTIVENGTKSQCIAMCKSHWGSPDNVTPARESGDAKAYIVTYHRMIEEKKVAAQKLRDDAIALEARRVKIANRKYSFATYHFYHPDLKTWINNDRIDKKANYNTSVGSFDANKPHGVSYTDILASNITTKWNLVFNVTETHSSTQHYREYVIPMSVFSKSFIDKHFTGCQSSIDVLGPAVIEYFDQFNPSPDIDSVYQPLVDISMGKANLKSTGSDNPADSDYDSDYDYDVTNNVATSWTIRSDGNGLY